MSELIVAATPIDGDCRRLDPRVISAISEADLLIAEERKNAVRLLAVSGCKDKPFILLNEHSDDEDREYAVNQVLNADISVFVSDAGTPCVADPDYAFVNMCIKSGVTVKSVPGASSIVAALSVSGFPTERFVFMGFPPRDRGKRKLFFNELSTMKMTSVFLERPYALKQTLEDMAHIRRAVSVCVALGTAAEYNVRGTVSELSAKLDGVKNAFAVVLSPAGYSK